MTEERRNLYRILHVQPEAPPEVIKAAYRALMTTLRAHPDLGGDHERAARLNAAYAVLSDPDSRRAYDRSMQRPLRAAVEAPAAPVRPADPWSWLAEQRCPFCATPFAARAAEEPRCPHCGSPLATAPESTQLPGELIGRRRGERVAHAADARIRLPGQPGEHVVRLRDLSLTGLSLVATLRPPRGSAFRIVTPRFDAVAVVVATGPAGIGYTVHARLLTLQLLRSPSRAGERVDATA